MLIDEDWFDTRVKFLDKGAILAQPDIERKIFFYTANVGRSNNGTLLPFQPTSVLNHILDIPAAGPDRRLEIPDDKTLYCWVDDNGSPQKVRLATIRKSDFPSVEASGMLSALQLGADEGLADEIHVVFFDRNIVGAIYNFHGPRISALAKYFSAKARHIYPNIRFDPLVDPETENRLNQLQDIRLLDLRLEPSTAEIIASQSKPLGDALTATRELFDAEGQIEIVARRKPYAKGGLGQSLLDTVKRIYRNTPIRESAERFRIEGINNAGEREFIDLLSDDLVVSRRVLKQDSRLRAIRRESAFEAITSAYEEVEHKLERAKSLQILRSAP